MKMGLSALPVIVMMPSLKQIINKLKLTCIISRYSRWFGVDYECDSHLVVIQSTNILNIYPWT